MYSTLWFNSGPGRSAGGADARTFRFRRHLRPAGAQHRIRHHERPHLRPSRRPRQRPTDGVRGIGQRRRVEIGQWRHHLKAGLPHSRRPVDRRRRRGPTNSKIVWTGTGESWVRNSVSVGDGIWKKAPNDE